MADYPLPWRWLDFPDGSSALMDAASEHVLTAEVLPSPDDEENAFVRPSSPYVREVTAAAPELEALVSSLCELVDALSPSPTQGLAPIVAQGRAVLARLAAARKARRDV